jgi:hypothetical protein
MTNFTTKQLCFIGRIGPAFSPDELPTAHAVLDRASIPRRLKGASLTLPERISYLIRLLEEARSKPCKQIFVITKKQYDDSIAEQYQEGESKS